MLDIRNAKIINYDNDKKNVTVYRDFVDVNLWYVQPTPLFANELIQGETIPVFSLVEYVTQSGDMRATCSFTVELSVPSDAMQAVREALPNATFGQFDWQEADAFLDFSIEGKQYTYTITPSLAGSNQAAFILYLDDGKMVDFFKQNFGPNAPAISTFNLSYNVTALAKLQAVKATVSYDASKAYEYEKTVQKNKNMWGSVTSTKVTIHENLKSSDAGKTLLDWGIPNPSAEFQQRVNNWAYTTLEGLVDRAYTEAVAVMGPGSSDNFTAQYVASFERVYEENQVIEWVISPTSFLQAKAISDNWDQHYSKVDFRRLITGFNILGNMNDAKVETINLSVTYGDVVETHIFDSKTPTQWTFAVDGRKNANGEFISTYSYQYTVIFTDGNQFTSESLVTSETNVSITLANLGLVYVTFNGENIDFTNIESVDVNFILSTPKGEPNINQTKRIKADEMVAIFDSQVQVNGQNFEYTYGFEYNLVSDGLTSSSKYVMAPILNQGGAGTANILIPDPIINVGYTIFAIDGKELKVKKALLTATYDDEVNDVHERGQYTFDPQISPLFDFNIKAVKNPNASFVRFNGVVTLSDSSSYAVRNIYLDGRNGFLELQAEQRPFTVQVDPTLVAWDKGVMLVSITLFTMKKGTSELSANLTEVELKNAENVQTLTFAKGPMIDGNRQPAQPQYYSFQYDPDNGIQYFYRATYFHEGDKANTFVAETEGDAGTIILPKDPTITSPKLISVFEAPRLRQMKEMAAE